MAAATRDVNFILGIGTELFGSWRQDKKRSVGTCLVEGHGLDCGGCGVLRIQLPLRL